MAVGGGFIEKITNGNKRKDDLTVIVDASSLIRMAVSLIDPQDMHRDDPSNPTLLSYLAHLGKLGAKIVIPESVIFETTGHRGDGTQLTRQFENDIEYPYLRNFFDAIAAGKIKNVSIIRTPFANMHLAEMEELRENFEAFNRYRREHLIGFGDTDIVQMYDRSTHHGRTFVITEDRGLTDTLEETKNKQERPIGVVSAFRACADIQRVSPISWLRPETSTTQIREHFNASCAHENAKRIEQNKLVAQRGYGHYRTLQRPFDNNHQGYSRITSTEVDFDEAIYKMLHAQQEIQLSIS
ncbi:MAG: hypothetical protein ACK502_10625 [Alphaproteobacteria bacterium]